MLNTPALLPERKLFSQNLIIAGWGVRTTTVGLNITLREHVLRSSAAPADTTVTGEGII